MSSDLDPEAYLELMKESARTGKSVQQILAERQGLPFEQPKVKMTEEVKKTLAENSWGASQEYRRKLKEENNE